LVDMWESAMKHGDNHADIAPAAQAAASRFAQFAKLYPVCRPSALVLEGRVERLRGNSAAAQSKFDEAAGLARRIGMAGDEARAMQEMGRAWPPTMEIRRT
jgi:hypothetical protein